jgi:HD-GYP domain-containing protein (c-di-GMP phosphodiesterase class II)
MDRLVITHDQKTLGRALIHGQHGTRCMRLATAVATALGLHDTVLLRELEEGAFLHDVGKAWVDEWVVLKAGPFTPDEYKRMQMHPIYGVTFLQSIDINGDVAAIVRHHHERWDGSGYPDELRGTAIPMGARIVGPIDTYDALMMHRDYPRYDAKGTVIANGEFSHEDAMRIVEASAGTRFDPRVVKAFCRLKDREFR